MFAAGNRIKGLKKRMKKAIKNIKLDLANDGKLDKLEATSHAYMSLVQAYIDNIFDNQRKEVKKYDAIPEIATHLSARWQRCAWQQAVGIMKSFFSNSRTNKPILASINIQANSNVIKIQASETGVFDYWLQIATLEKGQPILVPIKMYAHGLDVLKLGKLCSGVILNKVNGVWYATFVVDTPNEKPKANQHKKVGMDLGITHLFTTKAGFFGQFSDKLKILVDKADIKNRRKQKLNACLKKKGKSPLKISNPQLNGTIKNEIGQAINQFIETLDSDSLVILEKLNIKAMRFKSRRMNRILKASKISYALEKLKEKLNYERIRYASVPAAYSSQECSECGYVHEDNRPTQAKFKCGFCGHQSHADVNSGDVLVKRFGDTELFKVNNYREVKTILMERFFKRFPDARSASGGLELSAMALREIGCLQLTVNQST